MVRWKGELYLEDGLHRTLRAALQQRETVAARVYDPAWFPGVEFTHRGGELVYERRGSRRYRAPGNSHEQAPPAQFRGVDHGDVLPLVEEEGKLRQHPHCHAQEHER